MPNWRFPCSVCGLPVKINQKGLYCNSCCLWIHTRCCGVSDAQYVVLGGLGDSSPWYCPSCVFRELPFANSSFVSDSTSSKTDVSFDSDHPLFHNSSVVLCHINIRSLLPSLEEVRELLSGLSRPAILGVTETWLHSSVTVGEISVPGYVVHRRDRNSRGGGVLVYVAHSCRSWRRPDLEDPTVEVVWVELRVESHPMLLCDVYRPPSSDGSLLTIIGHMLEMAIGENKEVILMGDLNVNMMSTSTLLSSWNLIIEECSLTQLIGEPTHVTPTNESLLDVLFTTNPRLFASAGTFAFSNSDHLLIYGERVENLKGSSQFTRVRCFRNRNVEAFVSDLQRVPWQTMNIFSSVDKWGCWKSLFISIVDVHFPLHTVRLRRHSLKWMNGGILKLMRTCNYYRTKFR